jgi:hypothetical protein
MCPISLVRSAPVVVVLRRGSIIAPPPADDNPKEGPDARDPRFAERPI